MLAMADRKGRIWASVPGLANRARVPLEDAEKALATFLAPDKYSRTPDHDGRRIEAIDGGWQLLNHAKYRDMRDDEIRREYQREWDRKNRPARNPNEPDKSDKNRPQPTKAEAEADTEACKSKAKVAPLALPPWLNVETWTAYVQTRKAPARKPKSLQGALKKLEGFRAEGFDPNEIVATSLANGWQGLFPPDARRGPGAQAPDYSSLVNQ